MQFEFFPILHFIYVPAICDYYYWHFLFLGPIDGCSLWLQYVTGVHEKCAHIDGAQQKLILRYRLFFFQVNAYNWKIFALLSSLVGIRRWIFIHCYRPPWATHTIRVDKSPYSSKKTNSFIDSSVRYFAERTVNSEHMRERFFFFFFEYPFALHFCIVCRAQFTLFSVPAFACDSGQMVELSLSREHCTFHGWDVYSRTRIAYVRGHRRALILRHVPAHDGHHSH